MAPPFAEHLRLAAYLAIKYIAQLSTTADNSNSAKQ